MDKHIFEFNYNNGEIKDWVYADNEDEAVDLFCNKVGDSEKGARDSHVITIMPREDWKTVYTIDPNESEPDPDEIEYDEDDYCQGYKIVGTFEDLVKDTKKSFYLTSTDCDL